MIIRNGLIHDALQPTPYVADIEIKEGKIVAIGKNLPKGEEEIDATGLTIYPGFVEAHGHTGLEGYGIGFEGMDINEMGDVISPHLRAIDGFQPFDKALEEGRNAGVTTLCVGPGSANVLGGTFMVIKPVGKKVDDMVILKEAAMKCAFGENPKRCYKEKGNSTRMTTAAHLREMLFKAKEYNEKYEAAKEDPSKKPSFDMKLEALLPVIRGEMPLKAHAHQANDLFTAIRIAKEFQIKLTLEHCTEGHLVAEELAKENIPMAVGPTLTHAGKYELRNKTWCTPDVLTKAGAKVSIITDAPVIPQQYLPLCAGLAVKSGMDSFEALKAITIHPAQHIGVAQLVGSLEVGKDADIVIADGCVFSIETTVKKVLINGEVVFEKEG
ncbi:MAG: amidohydrolase [Clostridiales bacterium]|nr:amidohydrolase [Clostridiales bacterium]